MSSLYDLIILPINLIQQIEKIDLKINSNSIYPRSFNEVSIPLSFIKKLFLYWGDFIENGNVLTPSIYSLPSDHQINEIQRIYKFISNKFMSRFNPSIQHFMFPVLPEISPGDFNGEGLAGWRSSLIMLPINYKEMDQLGFLWLVAHEIAHQWIGIGIRFREDIKGEFNWIIEGLPSYLALLALCQNTSISFKFYKKMLFKSLLSRGNPLHTGLLIFLCLDAIMMRQENHQFVDIFAKFLGKYLFNKNPIMNQVL